MKPSTNGRIATTALALAALPAFAGIKYWDNPDYRAFDVDCYVPGAVWNFDGIRNAGADQPHSTTATTWKNLGSSGSGNDMFIRITNQAGNGWGNTSALASLGTVNERDTGSWTDNGFAFAGDSELRYNDPGRIDTGTSYTIQMLVDGTIDGQAYPYTYLMSIQKDHFAFTVDKSAGKLYWKTQNSTTSNHPFMTDGSLGYMTAILDGTANTAAFFSGTVPPSDGDGFRQFSSVSGKSDTGGCICGYTAYNGFFTGTMHSYRYYTRVLTEEELAWNRVVDERRFFDRAAPLPVTNVVVVSSIAASTEPAGTYAVDGRHVFTAPRVVTVGTAKFICVGYTLESWDDATCDWGAAVFHARELSCKVEDADHVRITWKWMDGEGIKTYDVSDYVWDGLETFYDGICNQGTNVAHSTTATNWVNIGDGPQGASNDLKLQRYTGSAWADATSVDAVGNYDPGEWTDNGFTFAGQGRFRCDSPGKFDVGTSYSLQMLIDAKASEQISGEGVTTHAYPFAAQNETFALDIRRTDNNLYWCVLSAQSDYSKYPYISGGTYDYITAIMDGANNKQMLFSGTSIPSSGTGYKTDTAKSYNDTGFALGGYGKSTVTAERFVGTIKSFRQYDHALTAAEVAQNRKVDDFRYFGKFTETDVIVQSTYAALQGNEPDGEYDVDGSHTFTAPASVTIKVNGREIAYACDGYTVETWGPLANKGDGWSAATHYIGTSYAYTTAAGKVRLTWKWKATRGLRAAADYSFADYSQAGIVWNFDGIYNQGVGVERSTTATTWKNLAPNPVTSELFVQRINSARNNYDNSSALSSLEPVGDRDPGEWTEDGFRLKGDSRWRGLGQVGPVANWTLQTLVDADVADVVNDIMYVISVSWSNFAVVLRKNNSVSNSFHFNVQDTSSSIDRPYIQNESGKYDFATAILDSSDRTAKMFSGVTPPSGGTIADGYYQFPSITPFKDNNFGFGASTSYTEFFIGTLKSVRYYDRVLTEEEIVRNRNVDAVRYFGALGVTNLVVEVEEGYAASPAAGAYYVEGSYTFAPAAGTSGTATGYKLQDWDEATGKWTNSRYVEGASFQYAAAAATAPKMKLIWCKPKPFTLIVR